MNTDPIADYLTRVRNAIKANHRIVEIPASNLKKDITKVLLLKYHPLTKIPAIRELKRVSKPGLRQYRDSKNLPRVINGLGIAIMSTSKGVMTDKEARKENVGGEVICYVS